MKRKIFSILFAVVLVVSLSLVTAVPAGAVDLIRDVDVTVISSPAHGAPSPPYKAATPIESFELGEGIWEITASGAMNFDTTPGALAPNVGLRAGEVMLAKSNVASEADAEIIRRDGFSVVGAVEGPITVDLVAYGGTIFEYNLVAIGATPSGVTVVSSGDHGIPSDPYKAATPIESFELGEGIWEITASGAMNFDTTPGALAPNVGLRAGDGEGVIMLAKSNVASEADAEIIRRGGFSVVGAVEGPTTVDLVAYGGSVFEYNLVAIGGPGPVVNEDSGESYGSIQDAIDDAKPGDTITVAAGTYTEAVTIDRSLTLNGAKMNVDPRGGAWTGDITTIDAAGNASGIEITASDVTINGFKVIGSNPSGQAWVNNAEAGICVSSSSQLTNIVVQYNWLDSNGVNGIFVKNADNPTIEYNYCSNNGDSDANIAGISADGLVDGSIAYNECSGNHNYGIYLGNGSIAISGTTISHNDLHGNLKYGIELINQGKGVSEIQVVDNKLYENGRNGLKIVSATDCTIRGNEFYLNGFGAEATSDRYEYGVLLEACRGGSNTQGITTGNTFMRNTFHDNALGGAFLWYNALVDADSLADTSFHQNNFIEGSGKWGINNTSSDTVDATNNWWGDVTGPKQATTNPGGEGNKVSGNVDYMPWLTRDFKTVLAEGIGYYGFAMAYLGPGWNILSTPFLLDDACNTWGEYVTFNKLHLYTGGVKEYVNAYYFDSSAQDWGEVTDGYVLKPCDAIYVRMAEPDIAALLVSPERWVPTKTLSKGWNLVGLSWIPPTWERYALRADFALKSVEVVGSDAGYTQVVSPWMNQPHWTFVPGMIPLEWGDPTKLPPGGYMMLTKGYWVFMENGPDDLAGSWPTPMGLPPR